MTSPADVRWAGARTLDVQSPSAQSPDAQPTPSPIGGPGVPSTERVWFAQALRGVACLIVVWEHLAHRFLTDPAVVSLVTYAPADRGLAVREPGWQATVYQWLANVHVAPGQFGVSLFFLISGFVIPFSLERHRLGGFFVRRFFRLYPTLWVAIGATLVALAVQAHLLGTRLPVGGGVVGSSGLLFGSYVGKPWVDPVYWTLAIEELFYVIAALCAWRGLLHRRAVVAAIGLGLAVVSVSIARMATPTKLPVPPYWFLRTNLARNAALVIFILVGVAFHQHYRGRWSTRSALLVGGGLLAAFAVSLYAGPFPGQSGEYLGSGLAALAVFTPLYVLRDRVPHVGALDAVANISYPLYLVHTVVGWILLRWLLHLVPNFFVAVPVALALTVALAAVIHRLVETPSNQLGRRIVSRPAFRRPDPEQVAR